jgi:hypothetical protein
MRALFALAATALLAPAQSHPSWWNWASPDATALVGIHWEAVRSSPLAEALADELGPEGSLGLPDLQCLKESKQLLLSSPAFLVVANGDFPAEQLRAEAAQQSMKASVYKGVELWISPGKSTLSVARIGDHILLLGLLRSLEGAIDRNPTQLDPVQTNQTPPERRYSPLLRRAARFSGQDLWVVASQLPDPLASHFVPLDVDARGFEGSVSLADGIRLEGTLAAGSQDEASAIALKVRQSASGLPSVARGLQAVQAGDMVVLAMVASREQVAASLRPAAPSAAQADARANPEHSSAAATSAVAAPEAVTPKVQAAAKPAPTPPAAAPPVAVPPAAPAPITVAASAPEPIVPVPAEPRVVRIFGLDDGPREIVLPPLAR